MLELFAAVVVFAVALLTLALLAGVFKLVFKIALLPIALAFGVVKATLVVVAAVVGVVLVAAVGVPLLAVTAVLALPLLLLAGTVWVACKLVL